MRRCCFTRPAPASCASAACQVHSAPPFPPRHSALLPGELPAGSLLARLLPLSDTGIGSKQSRCSIKRDALMNHGKRRKAGEAPEPAAPAVRGRAPRPTAVPSLVYNSGQQSAFTLLSCLPSFRDKHQAHCLSLLFFPYERHDSLLAFKLVQLKTKLLWRASRYSRPGNLPGTLTITDVNVLRGRKAELPGWRSVWNTFQYAQKLKTSRIVK